MKMHLYRFIGHFKDPVKNPNTDYYVCANDEEDGRNRLLKIDVTATDLVSVTELGKDWRTHNG